MCLASIPGRAPPSGRDGVNKPQGVVVNICKREFQSKQIESKSDELCRERQVIRLRCTAADVLTEADRELDRMSHPEELAGLVERYRARLDVCEYAALIHALEMRFGVPMARQAGLPVGRPTLRIAG